jgi:hypothetical protein
MSDQSRKIKHEAIPQWAQGLYYNKGLFTEVIVYSTMRHSTLSIEVRRAP